MIRFVRPGSGSWFFPHPGSRGQKGTGSRIPDPDPQHWMLLVFFLLILVFFTGYPGDSRTGQPPPHTSPPLPPPSTDEHHVSSSRSPPQPKASPDPGEPVYTVLTTTSLPPTNPDIGSVLHPLYYHHSLAATEPATKLSFLGPPPPPPDPLLSFSFQNLWKKE